MDAYLSQFYLAVGWEPYSWFGLFAAASLLDALLTLGALKRGGYEANPVMRWAMKKTSPVVALAALKFPQAALLFGSLQVSILYVPPIALIFVAVCVWNIWQIWSMK